jgi:hypothetical protein
MSDPTAGEASTPPEHDRRLDLRYVGPVDGCYTLSSHLDLANGAGVLPFRTLSISSSQVTITGPLTGKVGDSLTAKIDGFGIIRGTIERLSNDSLTFRVVATERHRLRIAIKIDFLKQKAARKQSDRRLSKRRQPGDLRSTLALPDGRILNCLVVDFSRSGAAIATPIKPQLTDRVVIGRVPGRVVRYLPSGLGIEFEEKQKIEGLEALLTGYEVISESARIEPAA